MIDPKTLILVFAILIVSLTVLLWFILKSSNVKESDLSFKDNGIGSILEEFYRLRNNHAKIAFNFSIISASAGFVLFLYAVIRFLSDNDTSEYNAMESWISVIAGAITEVIAALFFSIQKRADKELQNNIDGLRVHALLNEFDQKIKVEDKSLKDEVREDIIKSLLRKHLPPDRSKPDLDLENTQNGD